MEGVHQHHNRFHTLGAAALSILHFADLRKDRIDGALEAREVVHMLGNLNGPCSMKVVLVLRGRWAGNLLLEEVGKGDRSFCMRGIDYVRE